MDGEDVARGAGDARGVRCGVVGVAGVARDGER